MNLTELDAPEMMLGGRRNRVVTGVTMRQLLSEEGLQATLHWIPT